MKAIPLLLLTALLFVPVARSAPIEDKMPESPTPLVSILPATPANLPQLDSAVVEKFHPHAFILANNSDRAIVGLVVQWTYTDANGKAITRNVRSDSFMLVTNNAVVRPHARLLVAPGAFVSEANVGKQHMGSPIERMDGGEDIQGATGIAVTIDIIIFDDSQITGPNTTHFDTELQNRKLAATAVAKQVRNAMARGEDTKAILTRISGSVPERDDMFGTWTVRYARMLSRRYPSGHPTLEAQLQSLENLPEPPNFHK